MSVTAIIQARMGSSRLPGKTLADLGGAPLLDWVTTGVLRADGVDDVIVATSHLDVDTPIVEHLAGSRIACHRGSPDDVLDRFVGALQMTTADTIIRITADCPFVQPELIDRGLRIYRADAVDYVATALDGRMPRGFDVEVVRRSSIEEAAREATDPGDREHVTPFIVRRPERFRHAPLTAPEWARRTDLRLTVDEPDDLRALRAIADCLDATPGELHGRDVIRFLDAHPEVVAINANVAHRTAY